MLLRLVPLFATQPCLRRCAPFGNKAFDAHCSATRHRHRVFARPVPTCTPNLRFPPIMPVDQPFNIYREQLSSQYHGLALWNPNPVDSLFRDPGHVSIGDVGYLDNGTFMRIFNAKLPRDHPSNQSIELREGYEPLKREHFDNVRHNEVRQEEYQSQLNKVDNLHAISPDE
jgi:hypothetical protein